eukprot:TRINITY_DN18263_c0_g1_i1.p1 TRINITY_DN18263_c0_g1~~TRINITY_DN18263_c0_g1_i1.p1  ORF type:complete len:304 (+),score=34.19 TRINITY_DN18263_c0_g1_i1:529-1440(+)
MLVAALLAPLFPGGSQPAFADGNEVARAAVYTGTGQQALAKIYPDAARWMTLDDDQQVLGLLFQALEEPAKGAVLLLNDAGETAASGVNGQLAAELAGRGWTVLAFGIERPGPGLQSLLEQPPAAPGAGANGQSGDGGENTPQDSSVMIDVAATKEDGSGPVSRYRARMRNVIEVGIGELKGLGFERVALAGVGRACNYLLEPDGSGGERGALVWIDPAFYPVESAALIDRLMAADGAQVLELEVFQNGDDSAGQRRQSSLMRAGFSGYKLQRVVTEHPPEGLDGVTLASRVGAWLSAVFVAD